MTSTVVNPTPSQLPTLTIVDPIAIIRLAESRGVVLETDGSSLRVNGPATAIAALRPHLISSKAAVIEHLVANPNPIDRGPSDGGQGEASGGRSSSSAPTQAATPLAILAALQFHPATRFRPTETDIELALWLTEFAAVVRADLAAVAAGQANRDPGFMVNPITNTGHPIAPTVLALARGPTQGESAAAWLDRMSKLRQLVDDGGEQREDQPRPPPSSWRATRGYVAGEWPADRKR